MASAVTITIKITTLKLMASTISGKIGPVYRVDLFHFALCGAVYSLRSGLLSIV